MHYEMAGARDTNDGRGTNGLDDAGATPSGTGYVATPVNGIIDEADERVTSPPYPVPLRGIQIKLRVYEPESRTVREVTVVESLQTD
jgi:hypothetical protein